MQSRILLEEPATGYFHLSELLKAMETSVKAKLTYHPFNKDSYTTLLSAYCLKVFKQRWYALGFSSYHQEVRTFALDRIESIELTGTPFPYLPNLITNFIFNTAMALLMLPI